MPSWYSVENPWTDMTFRIISFRFHPPETIINPLWTQCYNSTKHGLLLTSHREFFKHCLEHLRQCWIITCIMVISIWLGEWVPMLMNRTKGVVIVVPFYFTSCSSTIIWLAEMGYPPCRTVPISYWFCIVWGVNPGQWNQSGQLIDKSVQQDQDALGKVWQ